MELCNNKAIHPGHKIVTMGEKVLDENPFTDPLNKPLNTKSHHVGTAGGGGVKQIELNPYMKESY